MPRHPPSRPPSTPPNSPEVNNLPYPVAIAARTHGPFAESLAASRPTPPTTNEPLRWDPAAVFGLLLGASEAKKLFGDGQNIVTAECIIPGLTRSPV